MSQVTIEQVIPEGSARKVAYRVFLLLGVVFGSLQVAFLVLGTQPIWLTVALAVYAYLASGLFQKAQKYAPVGASAVVESYEDEAEDFEESEDDGGL